MRSDDKQYWSQQEAQGRAICNELAKLTDDGGIHGDTHTGAMGWCLRDVSSTPAEWRSWQLQRIADGLELSLGWPDAYTRERAERSGDRKDLRLTIAGVWPRDHAQQTAIPSQTKRGGHTTEISVDLARPAEAIAKEIQRRLLPGFEALHKRSAEIIRSRNAYGDETERTLARILAAIPGSYRGQHSKASVYFQAENYAYVVSCQGESVRFEAFSAPVEAAIAALQVLSQEAAQAVHEADDPHCTCNDCIRKLAAELG